MAASHKVGYRPVVRAREGLMFGIRQPLDGPIFDTLEDARNWCIHALSQNDGRFEMSDTPNSLRVQCS